MENVDRARKSAAFAQACTIFRAAGYGLTQEVLNANRCGIPQSRRRIFVIGALGANDNFLSLDLQAGLATRAMTVRDHLGNELGVDDYYSHPRGYDRRSVFSIDESAPTVRGTNRLKPCPSVRPHLNDTAALAGVRGLEPEERARIQTFPKDFQWLGCRTNKDKMVGNAVPVELARYVGATLARYEASMAQQAVNDNSLQP